MDRRTTDPLAERLRDPVYARAYDRFLAVVVDRVHTTRRRKVLAMRGRPGKGEDAAGSRGSGAVA